MKELGDEKFIDDWFIGWRDCEKGLPEQQDSKGYKSGYSACYHDEQKKTWESEHGYRRPVKTA